MPSKFRASGVYLPVCRTLLACLICSFLLLVTATPRAFGQEASLGGTSDAWWTGTLLTIPAVTVPKGGLVLAAIFWDQISTAQLDGSGRRRPIPTQTEYAVAPFILYGLADRFNIGLIPKMGFHDGTIGNRSSNVQLGDWTFQSTYQLTQFGEDGGLPSITIGLGETVPTGNFDRLARVGDGLGKGVYVTRLSVSTLSWYEMPTGRTLRLNMNMSYALNGPAHLDGRSVYGTDDGFAGRVHPTTSFFADLGLEYSLSRQWVAMTELAFQHDGDTRVTGTDRRGLALETRSGTGDAVFIMPSVQYSWTASVGTTLGVRFLVAGRNETVTTMPMLAVNWYLPAGE